VQWFARACALIGHIRQAWERKYRNAEKRLSNEFDETTGAAPGIAAGGAGVSVVAGLASGRAFATCFGSAGFSVALGGAAGFAATTVRCGATCLGATAFGFATGTGGLAEAVVSLPPKPIFRAKLLKMLSDSALGAADASSADDGRVIATTGSDDGADTTELATGSCGGLTVAGMVPGAGE
jgi:hypothetical protein